MNRNRSNLVTGAAILAVILLAIIIGLLRLDWVKNWWAIFLLIPSIASINNVYQEIKQERGMSFSLFSNAFGIVFPLAFTIILLLGLDWSLSISFLIILAGLALGLVGFVKDKQGSGKLIQSLRFWFWSAGSAVILIGIITFTDQLQVSSISQSITQWYGLSLIIAACGGFLTIWHGIRQNGKPSASTYLHLVISLVFAIPGLLAILNKSL
jgi:hypothetical protein